jgi:hypothetical protein
MDVDEIAKEPEADLVYILSGEWKDMDVRGAVDEASLMKGWMKFLGHLRIRPPRPWRHPS